MAETAATRSRSLLSLVQSPMTAFPTSIVPDCTDVLNGRDTNDTKKTEMGVMLAQRMLTSRPKRSQSIRERD